MPSSATIMTVPSGTCPCMKASYLCSQVIIPEVQLFGSAKRLRGSTPPCTRATIVGRRACRLVLGVWAKMRCPPTSCGWQGLTETAPIPPHDLRRLGHGNPGSKAEPRATDPAIAAAHTAFLPPGPDERPESAAPALSRTRASNSCPRRARPCLRPALTASLPARPGERPEAPLPTLPNAPPTPRQQTWLRRAGLHPQPRALPPAKRRFRGHSCAGRANVRAAPSRAACCAEAPRHVAGSVAVVASAARARSVLAGAS